MQQNEQYFLFEVNMKRGCRGHISDSLGVGLQLKKLGLFERCVRFRGITNFDLIV